MPVRALLAALALLAAAPAAGQTIPPRGTPDTFDLASWNIEWFGHPTNGPADDSLQFRNVRAVFRQAALDVWGLQEIASPATFDRLLGDLIPSGYNGLLGPGGSDTQRLAYVYRMGAVEVLGVRTILSEQSFNFAGRLPLELRARVTAGGVTEEVRVINFHAKAFGGEQDYNRRLGAAQALKAHTDELLDARVRVLLVGDFNDRLRVSTAGGRPSPYLAFVEDERYQFATEALDLAGTPTFCGNAACTSGSPIDHIGYSEPFFSGYVEGSGGRYEALLTSLPSYRATTSDHLPVVASFRLGAVGTSAENAPGAGGLALRLDGPNPLRAGTTLAFTLAEPARGRLDLFDVLGRRVLALAEGPWAAGTHRVFLDAAGLAPGTYVARLEAGAEASAVVLGKVR